MADIFTHAKRSQIMASVRSRGNESTELSLAALFRRRRISGWLRNQRVLGSPDFVFRKLKFAVFVDGCFWHGCPDHVRIPANNRDYWERKIDRNRARDREITRALKAAGWRVLRIWDHELKHEARLVRRIRKRLNALPRLSTMRRGSKRP
jgi:DNA mismatch endonuclease (patch repair protein)